MTDLPDWPSSPSGGSDARTFFHFGDGTGGTIALPDGVSAFVDAPPGAYIQNGRAYYFGVVVLDLDTVAGASIGSAHNALVVTPPGLAPSSLETPSAGWNIFVGQATSDDLTMAWQFGGYAYNDGLWMVVPGNTLPLTDPAWPTTGLLKIPLNTWQYDVAGE